MKNSIDIYPDYDGNEYNGTINDVAADIDGYYVEFDLHLHIIEQTIKYSYDTPPETTRIKEDIEIDNVRIYLEGDEITDIMADDDYDFVVEEIKNRLWIA